MLLAEPSLRTPSPPGLHPASKRPTAATPAVAAPHLVNPILVNLFLDNPLPLTVLLAQPLIPLLLLTRLSRVGPGTVRHLSFCPYSPVRIDFVWYLG
ncbi:hypothetical protein [Streptomyces sp. NPDC048612]|uniref:hypothetical protein n=1 Tax=Streptomyces sp. NPDC048612 TaxID=3365579 RepID=UPI00371C8767